MVNIEEKNIINEPVFMIKIVLLVLVSVLAYSQRYLPKERGNLPLNDLYSTNIARTGKNTFRKVDGHGWATVISSYPIRPNAVTKVTFYLETDNNFMIGCGVKGNLNLRSNHPGKNGDTMAYYTDNGEKYINGDNIDYGTRAVDGDNVTMIINTNPYENWVAYEVNGNSQGIAFQGLNDWDDIYIMFGIYYAGHRITITDYEVVERGN